MDFGNAVTLYIGYTPGRNCKGISQRNIPMDVIVQDWQYWVSMDGEFPNLMKPIIPIRSIYKTTA